MIYVQPGEDFTESFNLGDAGLVGTVGAKIVDADDNIVLARATTGIVESDGGVYLVTRTAPSTVGYFTLIFDDGATPTPAVIEASLKVVSGSYVTIDGPSDEAIYVTSKLLQDLYDDPSDIDPILNEAIALVCETTWRTFAAPYDNGEHEYEAIPNNLMPIALRAVRLKTEEVALRAALDASEEAVSEGRLRSFSAGPYSESYADAGAYIKNQMVTANEALNEALMLLMTPDAKDEFLARASGKQRPAGEAVQFEFGTGYWPPRYP